MRFAILNEDGLVVGCELLEWAGWFQHHDRKIALDEILGYRVSTVFLGLNHNYAPEGEPPLWFETMIFNPDGNDIYCERYSTLAEARAGHEAALAWLRTRASDETLTA